MEKYTFMWLSLPFDKFDLPFFLFCCAFIPTYTITATYVFTDILNVECKNKHKVAAWAQSTLVAPLMSLVGLWALATLLQEGGVKALLWDADAFSEFAYKSSAISHRACLFFCAHCLVDLIEAPFCYGKEFGAMLLVHHLMYGHFMLYCISWGGEWGVCLFFLVEIPTFMLSIGSIHAPWRFDLSFGLVWFIVRILYHGLVIIMTTRTNFASLPYSVFCGWLAFALHVMWFWGWLKGKLGLKKKKTERRDSGADAVTDKILPAADSGVKQRHPQLVEGN
eukprot:GDKI01016906.1.p1 GENE.GDKI01016906.1~~GDKI01016906.1.p1  ORF type:complete len:279 (-),score=61.78 GDKI01016906.1:373-1209(-)